MECAALTPPETRTSKGSDSSAGITARRCPARLHPVPTLVWKDPEDMLLCLVDHLARFPHLHQPGQTKGTVMFCTTPDARSLPGLPPTGAPTDAKTAVLPSAHVLDNFWLNLVLNQFQGKDRFSPSRIHPLQVIRRQFHNFPRVGKHATGQRRIQMNNNVQVYKRYAEGVTPNRRGWRCLVSVRCTSSCWASTGKN